MTKRIEEIVRALDGINDRQLDRETAQLMAGTTVGGYTVRTDRKRRRYYVDVRLTLTVPMEEER